MAVPRIEILNLKNANKDFVKLTFTAILFSEKSFKIHRVVLVLLVWCKVRVHEQSHNTRLHTHNTQSWQMRSDPFLYSPHPVCRLRLSSLFSLSVSHHKINDAS